jgi:hypothetical protein
LEDGLRGILVCAAWPHVGDPGAALYAHKAALTI